MKKQYILSLLLFMYSFTAYTQDIFINADFVSSYMWRGMKCGNAAVQPTLGITMGGFTLSAWGSTEFRNENNEIDLTLEYQFKRLTLNVTNYFAKRNHSTTSTMRHTAAGIHSKQEPDIPSAKNFLLPPPGIPFLPVMIIAKTVNAPGPAIANSPTPSA